MHLLTGSGILAAFMALVCVSTESWSNAYIWLAVCLIIDGVDGTLAVKWNIKEILPEIDGKAIDFVVDFITYAFIPAFFFYQAEMVSGIWMIPMIITILMSSVFYYGKIDMVVEEQYFLGFPVLWNIVIFYLYFIFDNHEVLNIVCVFLFGILHFLPVKFAYPSKSKTHYTYHIGMGFLGILAALWILSSPNTLLIPAKIMTILVAAYFLFFAAYDTLLKQRNG